MMGIMQNIIEFNGTNMALENKSQYYPISLDDVKERVKKKKARRNGLYNGNEKQKTMFNSYLCENVKQIVNEFNEKIIRIDGNIPIDLTINKGDRFLFISYDQTILTHGLHKYPAKFFPELPRWIIKRYSEEKNIILDPFSGSGTTNVEALLNKRHSVGIDVDPFSRFLAKVKVTPLKNDELLSSQNVLLKLISEYKPSNVKESDIPRFPYRDNWFNKEIILELSFLKKSIELLNANQKTKDFFKVCLSSIIRAVSNADDNCTRTVIRKKLNKIVYPGDALKKFTESILINIPKMIEFSGKYPKNIEVDFPEDQDARNIKYHENYFDLAITSPPYANAVDYPRTHQLEIYWLGFSNGSLTPLKKAHVGTESVSSNEYRLLHKIGISDADYIISKIFKQDPRRAYIVFKYLNDMKKNLSEVYKVLKKNGRYVIVLGNNKIRGQVFENWKYISELGEEAGFHLENYFGSEIIKHFIKVPREERINTDWVIVLKK